MSKNSEALNRNLYELLRSRGFKPQMRDSAGNKTPVPEEAVVFQFQFIKDGKNYGNMATTIDGDKALIVYYGDDVRNSPDTNTSGTEYSDSWTAFIDLLRNWRFRNGLRRFDLENEDHLESDMARRDHMKKQEQIAEGYYAMGKKASYSDSIPTVKMVIQHSRQIEEGEQRYRNVARIFLENQEGERFLAPTTKPGIAKVYARHIAEGGKPHDDRWNHIGSLCEEYQKMAGFVRATRGHQFNESAQQLVESGINHYNSLRESLGKLVGHRGYNMYFESWTPPLMEDESDTTSINELFVQETLDPRIESVMPILSKLHKQVSEMAEVSALSEWADSLIEGGDGGEASEETDVETDADAGSPGGEDAPEDNLSEGGGGQEALNPIGVPESEGQPLNVQQLATISDEALDNAYHYGRSTPGNTFGWQANLKSAAYAKQMIDKGVSDIEAISDAIHKGWNVTAQQFVQNPEQFDDRKNETVKLQKKFPNKSPEEIAQEVDALIEKKRAQRAGLMKQNYAQLPDDEKEKDRVVARALLQAIKGQQGVEEGLDANQKRVGQLGPTEKVRNNNIGKLVGANENFINTVDQAVVTEEDLEEMDSQGYTGTRDDHGSGSGPDRYGKMTTAKKIAKAGLNILNKEMNQVQDRKTGKMYDPNKEFSKTMNSPEVQAQMKRMATKEDVAEGQDDFDAMMRIVRR